MHRDRFWVFNYLMNWRYGFRIHVLCVRATVLGPSIWIQTCFLGVYVFMFAFEKEDVFSILILLCGLRRVGPPLVYVFVQ
jgi:hypothetical protein